MVPPRYLYLLLLAVCAGFGANDSRRSSSSFWLLSFVFTKEFIIRSKTSQKPERSTGRVSCSELASRRRWRRLIKSYPPAVRRRRPRRRIWWRREVHLPRRRRRDQCGIDAAVIIIIIIAHTGKRFQQVLNARCARKPRRQKTPPPKRKLVSLYGPLHVDRVRHLHDHCGFVCCLRCTVTCFL